MRFHVLFLVFAMKHFFWQLSFDKSVIEVKLSRSKVKKIYLFQMVKSKVKMAI